MKKLYLAILNHGWIRTEIVTDLLPKLKATEGVYITWENPAKTWAHPISSNRNLIVRRFLETDHDFLLMLDDDVVPLDNPAEFVHADKDIVGFPAPVRQAGRQLNFVAYVKDPRAEDAYAPVDFALVDDDIELLKVDVVGTGCILIARRVLEALEAPFHTDFDEHGVCTVGTDFAFCRKAGAAGFEIFTTPQRVCEHYKQVGMLAFQGLSSSQEVDPAAHNYDIPWGGWAITPADWEFIKRIITDVQPRNILEFGAGLSTLLMSDYAPVISYETDAQWAERIRNQGTETVIVREWDGIQFTDMELPEPFDIVFIDGPPSKEGGGPGREMALFLAALMGDHIIVHDARREEETALQERYLRPEFKLVRRSGYHQACCQYWQRRGN